MTRRGLSQVLKVRPEEGRLALLVGWLFLCFQAGQGLGDNASSALFFLRFGVDFLPYMYIFLGATTFVVTLAYAAGLGHFGGRRFFPRLTLGLIALLLVERAALARPLPIFYPLIWLSINCMGVILGTFGWNLASEVSDPRQAKRLFPLFASAGILGSVLGNSVTGILAKPLGTDNLLLLYACLLGVVFLLTGSIGRLFLRAGPASGQETTLLGDLRPGFEFVRRSRLMRLIAQASVLFSVLFFCIAFPFNKVVAGAFPDEASVAGFLGLFNGVTTAVTFLVSVLIANRVYGRLGIVNSILLLPLAYLFGFVVFASNYSLPGAVVARFAQMVVLGGIGATAWNALFNVVPSQRRGQVLAFENGVPAQIGVVLSGILLLLGDRVLSTIQILVLGMLLTLLCGWIMWRMHAAYGEALLDALRAGRLEVFDPGQAAFAGLQGDAAALRVVSRALQDPKPTTRYLAAEILGKMRNPEAVPALTGLLRDGEARVRASAVRALGELQPDSLLDGITTLLDDPDAEVRLQALNALESSDVQPRAGLFTKLEGLLEDRSPTVRTQALAVLAKCGRRKVVDSHLMPWLMSEDGALRSAALNVFGKVSKYFDGRVEAGPVLACLDDPEIGIRSAACRALAGLSDDASARALAGCLADPQAAVREAAAESLRSRGRAVRDLVFEGLESGETSARDAALASIVADDEPTRRRLREFARREMQRTRSLRSQAASLPSDGRAITLLRENLQRHCRLGEERILRVVGLIGNPRAMDLVRKGILGSNPEARAAALEALETVGDKALARGIAELVEEAPSASRPSNVLGELLNDGDSWNRALAVRSIQELGIRELLPRVTNLQSDPDLLVRETVGQALAHVGEVSAMDTVQTVTTLERVLLLREVPIFSELSPEDLQQIGAVAREEWFPGGSAIFRQGDEGSLLYIIVEGELQVVRSRNGKDEVLSTRGPGDFVGEMAIIDAAPRSASLLTQGEVRTLAIDGETFKGILRERPEVALAVLRSLSRRLREMSA